MPDTKQLVLIIDDDTALSTPLSDTLKAAGYDTMVAHKGSDGVKAALEHHPKTILLDYQLPDQTGLDVLRQIREDEWGQRARVIFMTNTDDVTIINQVITSGVSEYLLKSDTPMEEIVNLVGRRPF